MIVARCTAPAAAAAAKTPGFITVVVSGVLRHIENHDLRVQGLGVMYNLAKGER